MSYDVYAGMLKMMDEFQGKDNVVHFQYSYDNSALKILKDKYHIDEIGGSCDSLSKSIKLLEWISSHIYHKSNYDGNVTNNALDLLEYSYDNGLECGINCRSLAIILTECCLAIGLKARTIYLMPFSPYDGDNHVVCEIFIPEMDKWIMLDPTYNGYFIDKDNNICGVLELRHALGNRKKLRLSDRFNYNGDYDISLEDIEEYYAKDLFYLKCRENHTFNSEEQENNRIIIFSPIGYDVKKATRVNIKFRIYMWGEDENIRGWKKSIGKEQVAYADVNELKKSPI